MFLLTFFQVKWPFSLLHQFHFGFFPLFLCLPSGVGKFLSCLLFFLFENKMIISTVFKQKLLEREAFSSTAARRNSARKTRLLSTTIPFDVLSITKSDARLLSDEIVEKM